MPHLLERSAVTGAIATGVRGVEGVDGLLAQHLGQVFQGGRLTAAEENLAVHVAHDGVRIVLVDGLQLTSRLQNKAGGDLTAADGRHQLFQIGNLPDVGALVDQAPHMDGQLAAVHIIRFVAQEVKKLGVDHADEEIKGGIRVRHDEEQRRFLIAQRVQLQFIVHCEVTQFLDVEGRKPSTAGNEDGLCRFARDEKSRTFSSNSQTSYILLNLVAKQSLDFVLHRLSGVLVEVDTDNIGRAVYLLSDGGCGVLCGGLCCCVSVFCHSIPPMNEKCPTRKG